MWGKGTLSVVTQIGVATVGKNVKIPQKIKKELPYNPAILHLGMYPKEMKLLSQRDICIPMFTVALFT